MKPERQTETFFKFSDVLDFIMIRARIIVKGKVQSAGYTHERK